MIRRAGIILILFFLSNIKLFGQSNLNLSGDIIDCNDSVSLTYATITLFKSDSFIAKTYIEPPLEKFYFKNLTPGIYKIQTEYFYYPKSIQTFLLVKDSSIQICLTANNIDSLLTTYEILPIYQIYYFGRPASNAEKTNEYAKKYGVQYLSMGCVPFGDFYKYNQVVKKILEFKNGKGWEEKLKSEIEIEN